MALLSRWRRIEGRLPRILSNRLRVMNKWLFLSVCAIIVAHLIEWRQEDGPIAE